MEVVVVAAVVAYNVLQLFGALCLFWLASLEHLWAAGFVGAAVVVVPVVVAAVDFVVVHAVVA